MPKSRNPRRRPKGEDAAISERAGKALDLRIAGASYRQIGAQLAVSERTAFYDVQTALASLDAVNAKKAERLRDLEARRLDVLQVALTQGIRSGDPRAILAAVRILERRARLYGLDAPTEITGPGGKPLTVSVTHQQLPPD